MGAQPLIRHRRPPTRLSRAKKSTILRYLRHLAKRLKKRTLTCRDVNRDGQININTLTRHFGGFSKLLIEAGLRPIRIYKRDPTRMLRGLQKLTTRLGRRPAQVEVNDNLPYNAHQYAAEFGSFEKACDAAEAWSARK